MKRFTLAMVAMALGFTLVSSATAERLMDCGVSTDADRLIETSGALADYLADGFSDTHPSATGLARALAELARTVGTQLTVVENADQDFRAAWSQFKAVVEETERSGDQALASVMPTYDKNVAQVESLVPSCPEGSSEAPAEPVVLIPCAAIAMVHQLADVGHLLGEYVGNQYGRQLPRLVSAGLSLRLTSASYHHLLHDIELGFPALGELLETVERAVTSGDLVGDDGSSSRLVRGLLEANRRAFERLSQRVGTCRPPTSSDGDPAPSTGHHHGSPAAASEHEDGHEHGEQGHRDGAQTIDGAQLRAPF